MTRTAWVVRLAALSGFLSVAFGAFAAHGAKDARAAELLHTGALYQMIHALAVFAWLAVRSLGKTGLWTPSLFLAGTVLFSGSLYALAFGAPRVLGMVTPLGGLAFLAGWLLLAWRAGTIEGDKA